VTMFSILLVLIYICFISLGLPDSLLGSAWPVLHKDIGVPMSYAGVISMVISLGTIFSSLISDRMVRRLGYGKITAFSILMTAVALFGFSVSNSFAMLIIWSIPYGLGAGGVDSVLNNYVALNFKPQHMSWLHCSWAVGASISPYIMSFSLIKLDSWNSGYFIVSVIQAVLVFFVFCSLPLWKQSSVESGIDKETEGKPLSLKEIFSISGAAASFITFFAYCSLELTASLWASSYLVQNRGISPETASGFASLFYIGITAGRAVNGFLAMKFSDKFLIRTGLGIIASGILLLLLPLHSYFALAGFIIIGLGCAPVYPCIIHMTPEMFGRERSQSIIGVQMAFAYTGFCIVPPLFGVIAEHIGISLFPLYLAIFLVCMIVTHELAVKQTTATHNNTDQ